jgi:hypothetical protein
VVSGKSPLSSAPSSESPSIPPSVTVVRDVTPAADRTDPAPIRPQLLRAPEPAESSRLDAIVSAYQQMVLERVDQGIAHMQRSAAKLMNEVASEVWRTVGPDAGDNLGERVIGMLARDDTVRSLISHSDERYHALDVRIQRMEAGLKMVADKMKQSHLAVVGDLEGMRQSLTTNLDRSAEQNERNLVALSEQLDSTGRRLHSRLVHATERIEAQGNRIEARVEQLPVTTQLDGALTSMMQQLQSLDRTLAGTPDLTARRVATVTGMMGDQVEAAAGALVRRIAQVADAAVDRVVAATETAAGRAVTTTEALAARVAARTEAVAGRALQATEELAERVAETTETAAERSMQASEELARRMEATGEALVNRFDSMGRVLVRAAARESEAIVSLDQSLRHMEQGLEDMTDSLESVRRDVSARPMTLITEDDDVAESITSIDDGFYGRRERRRRAAG